MPITSAYWGDGSLYGDGDYYFSIEGTPFQFSVEQEVHCHRLSVRVTYTAAAIPGAGEAFRIHDLRARVAPDSQDAFTHEAFVDATTPSERISAVVNYRGAEFILSHLQLIAQRKKHQPKG